MKECKVKGLFCIVLVLMTMSLTSLSYASVENSKTSSFDYISNEIDNEMLPQAVISMNKDTVYSETLSAGSVDIYLFTPTRSGLYTVETFGSTDTYGIVSGSGSTVNDDDSGEGLNFAIGFHQKAGVEATILVRHYSANGTGAYQIQVRDQRAQVYTFDYGDLNTIPDATTPISCLSGMGYATGNHQNEAKTHINATIATTFKRLNSEVFFFSGHGGTGGGSVVFLYSNGTYDWMNDTSFYFSSMKNTKVAVWSACNSAVDPDGTGPRRSIAQKSIDEGAKSAIGWDRVTYAEAARKWTNKFFTELGNSKTVSDAAAVAGRVFVYPWEGSYAGWQVLGNGDTYVSYPDVNPKSMVTHASVSQVEFDAFLNTFDYDTFPLGGGGTRYYKTINGLLTNDFYDVLDNGVIVTSKNTISHSEIASATQLQFVNVTFQAEENIVANGISFNKLVKNEEYTVYMKINKIMTPLKLIYADYESDDGISYQQVTCINLLDNSFIDYEYICTDE